MRPFVCGLCMRAPVRASTGGGRMEGGREEVWLPSDVDCTCPPASQLLCVRVVSPCVCVCVCVCARARARRPSWCACVRARSCVGVCVCGVIVVVSE
jgi:hypothetical protein